MVVIDQSINVQYNEYLSQCASTIQWSRGFGVRARVTVV